MSTEFTCDDKQTLIAYLYGEIDPAVRTAVDDHLASCRDCAAELAALGDVRSELGLWAAPDADLDFAIIRKSAGTSSPPVSNVLRPARWWNTVPVWAQAAAAILVVAAGLSIANLQIRSGPDGFVVSTGWMKTPAPVPSEPSGRDAAGLRVDRPSDEWKTALVSLEQRLRSEIRSTRDQQPTAVAARGAGDDATIRRVQQLITDAEKRHSQELAARLIDLTRDINMQRRADMQNISRVVGSYDEQLLRQRQYMNNLVRVSATPQQ